MLPYTNFRIRIFLFRKNYIDCLWWDHGHGKETYPKDPAKLVSCLHIFLACFHSWDSCLVSLLSFSSTLGILNSCKSFTTLLWTIENYELLSYIASSLYL